MDRFFRFSRRHLLGFSFLSSFLSKSARRMFMSLPLLSTSSLCLESNHVATASTFSTSCPSWPFFFQSSCIYHPIHCHLNISSPNKAPFISCFVMHLSIVMYALSNVFNSITLGPPMYPISVVRRNRIHFSWFMLAMYSITHSARVHFSLQDCHLLTVH